MTVYRKGTRWIAQTQIEPGRTKQIGTFNSRQEAIAAEVAFGNGSQGETVAAFAARWLEDFPRPASTTIAHYRERTAAFVAAYSSRPMASITRDEARTWARAHRSELPPLRAMFNDALDVEVVIGNPFARLALGKPNYRRDLPDDWLLPADIDRLCECAFQAHGPYGVVMAAAVALAAWTGIRPGELYALRWDDLSPGTSRLSVRRNARSHTKEIALPKNGLAREINYPKRAQRYVDLVEASEFKHRELVVASPRGNQFWQPSFSLAFKPVKAVFGRPQMAFYELRHFCATHLLSLGHPDYEVAVQLGHEDNGEQVRKTYGHPSRKRALEAMLESMERGAA